MDRQALLLGMIPNIARRWWILCPKRKVKQEIDGQSTWIPAEATEWILNSIRNDPVLLAAIRLRLSDISWWMRLLCQTIALRANGEERPLHARQHPSLDRRLRSLCRTIEAAGGLGSRLPSVLG